jgi:hypothetical protein
LKFHCDGRAFETEWSASPEIVRKFDRYQQLNEAVQGQTPAEALAILADLDPILNLESFRQMQRFLGEHGLDAGLVTDRSGGTSS